MLQLAIGIEWIGVHHDKTSSQCTENRHWILQQVRHHDGDSIALDQSGLVNAPGCECLGLVFQLLIRHRRTKIVHRRAASETLCAFGEYLDDRLVFVDVYFCRHGTGIRL